MILSGKKNGERTLTHMLISATTIAHTRSPSTDINPLCAIVVAEITTSLSRVRREVVNILLYWNATDAFLMIFEFFRLRFVNGR